MSITYKNKPCIPAEAQNAGQIKANKEENKKQE